MKNYMDAVRAAGIGRTPQLCQDALIETLEELFVGKKYNGQQSGGLELPYRFKR